MAKPRAPGNPNVAEKRAAPAKRARIAHDKRESAAAAAKVARAYRDYEARLRSAFESGYGRAIEETRRDKPARLLDLLRAHRALSDGDFDNLADWVEVVTRKPGRKRDEPLHETARLIDTLIGPRRLSRKGRRAVVDYASESTERTRGVRVDPDDVRGLRRRGRARRYPKKKEPPAS